MGRPSVYDEAVFSELLNRMSAGETLKAICAEEKFPDASTVRNWVIDDFNGCSSRYTRAREEQIHSMIDETVEISDDTSRDTITKYDKSGAAYDAPDNEWIQRSRLRVDTRKWLASKIVPKIYGEKIQQEVTGKDGGPLTVSWLDTPNSK